MATISVIIPAYNAERTILETIASVQKQTFADFEIIVIDDGSTDRTVAILNNIDDDRVKIFSYDNSGVAVARNRGISHATGEYIAFLDADDLWTPDKLELQLTALKQHPEAGVAYSWTIYFKDGEDTSFLGASIFFEGDVYGQLLVNNFLAHGSNPLIRREAIESVGEFDPAFPHCADWDYYLRLAARVPFTVVPKHQILYRKSSGSMTSKIDGIEKQLMMMFEKHFQIARPEYQPLKNKSLAWIYEYCTEQYLQYGSDRQDIDRAGQKLWKAIRLHPQILLENYGLVLIQWFIKRWILMQLRLSKP